MLPSSLLALRYAVGAPLGRGGMATVYRARHLALGRDVALKILHPPVADPSEAARGRARFEREARTAARLDHPGCVRVLDFGTCADGTRYLAMELLDGPTLRADLGAGPMAPATAARIGVELCRGLDHAHGAGVVHRDLKPENVMFARRPGPDRWRIVLIDFGLSRLAGDAAVTALGALVGSPSYLAPERALGGAADVRTDLYAVGVMLYEMVSGRRPFVADTPAAIARLHVHGAPPPLGPDVPAELAAIIRRAMARDPGVRYANAAELGRDLGRCAGGAIAPRSVAPRPLLPPVGVTSAETTWIRIATP